jgi:hypothetical protein
MNYLSNSLADLEESVFLGFMGAKVTCPVYMQVKKGACVMKTCGKNKTLNLQTGKCQTTPTVAIQCPANASLETQARAQCAAENLPISITNCNPFEYACGTAPVTQGTCLTAPYTTYNSTTGQCCIPGTASCIASSNVPGTCIAPYIMGSNGQCYNPNSPCGAAGYYYNQSGQCTYSGGVTTCPSGQTMGPAGVCVTACAQGYQITTTGGCVPSTIICPAGSALNQATNSCVQMGSSNCGAGLTLTTTGQCIASNIQCQAGYQLNQATGQCVSSANVCPQGYNSVGQCIGGETPSIYPGTPGAQYLPGPYSGPELTSDQPDDGSGADQSELVETSAEGEYMVAPQAYNPVYSPVAEANAQYNTEPGYAVQGSPSSGPCPPGTNAGTSDQWGAFQMVQDVCAQAGSQTAAQNSSGGYPTMTQVEQSDIATMTGLGFIRHLG